MLLKLISRYMKTQPPNIPQQKDTIENVSIAYKCHRCQVTWVDLPNCWLCEEPGKRAQVIHTSSLELFIPEDSLLPEEHRRGAENP